VKLNGIANDRWFQERQLVHKQFTAAGSNGNDSGALIIDMVAAAKVEREAKFQRQAEEENPLPPGNEEGQPENVTAAAGASTTDISGSGERLLPPGRYKTLERLVARSGPDLCSPKVGAVEKGVTITVTNVRAVDDTLRCCFGDALGVNNGSWASMVSTWSVHGLAATGKPMMQLLDYSELSDAELKAIVGSGDGASSRLAQFMEQGGGDGSSRGGDTAVCADTNTQSEDNNADVAAGEEDQTFQIRASVMEGAANSL